jgi:hypothetical protein
MPHPVDVCYWASNAINVGMATQTGGVDLREVQVDALGWVVGWVGGWVVGWLVGWLGGWLGGCLGGWLGGWLAPQKWFSYSPHKNTNLAAIIVPGFLNGYLCLRYFLLFVLCFCTVSFIYMFPYLFCLHCQVTTQLQLVVVIIIIIIIIIWVLSYSDRLLARTDKLPAAQNASWAFKVDSNRTQ